MESKKWLITGASRGLGKVLAGAALAKGHRCAVTARKADDLNDLCTEFPEQCLPLILDMNKPEEIRLAAAKVSREWRSVDVLVNNAGYGLQGMIEEVSAEQIRQQMETNFFGLAEMTRQIIPLMRAQRSGYIVNVSSMAGLRGMAALGIYNASKFAVEGFTEALAQEMKPFNIRVSVIEPGPYRTDWAGDSLQRSEEMVSIQASSPYAEENKRLRDFMDSRNGKQPGDPRQIAAVILEAAEHPQPPLHMIFGDIAIAAWQDRLKLYQDPKFMSFYPHDQYKL